MVNTLLYSILAIIVILIILFYMFSKNISSINNNTERKVKSWYRVNIASPV